MPKGSGALMEQIPKVFIVVLNYNGKAVTCNCLKSVAAVDYANYQLVLVDNRSADGSLEQAKKDFPDFTYLQNNKNLGFSAGNNVGIKYALEKGADYVLLLNNDTLVEKNFLTELINAAEQEPRAGIISPLIHGPGKDRIWFSRGRIDWLRMKTLHQTKRISKQTYDSPFLSGCAMLIPSDVFENVGLLDEDYFLYWEDADFCVKVRKRGYRTIVASKSAICHLEASESINKNKLYWLVYSGLIFFKKNTPWFLRPWIWSYLKIRRLNNWIKRARGKDENALLVFKAYHDFQNAHR